MPATDGETRGWLGGLADRTDRFVGGRVEHLAATVREKSAEIAEHSAERFARRLVELVAQRLAAELAWAAAAVGALIIAVWLLAVGISGALGEALGRPWLGQLVAGAITLLAALATGALVRARTRRRRAEEAAIAASAAAPQPVAPAHGEPDPDGDVADLPGQAALKAGTDLLRRHPLASLAAVSAVGLLIRSRRSRPA
jgi:hypothetical protein